MTPGKPLRFSAEREEYAPFHYRGNSMKNRTEPALRRLSAPIGRLSGLCILALCLCFSFPARASADDWYVQIIPDRSTISIEEAEALGQHMTRWMQDRNFIKREAAVLDFSGGGRKYAVTPKFALLLERPKPLGWMKDRYNRSNRLDGVAMEIIVGMDVYYPIEGEIESMHCSACKGSIAEDDAYDLASLWWKHPEEALACPLCGVKQDISAYVFEPPWGFSSLCFRFWYVPDLQESFVKSFAEELGEPVRIVYGGTW